MCSAYFAVGKRTGLFCFPDLEVERVQTLYTPHLSDSFITTKFLCFAAVPLRLALVVLAGEKLAPDEMLCLCALQLGKKYIKQALNL